jgi:hypothetical protein
MADTKELKPAICKHKTIISLLKPTGEKSLCLAILRTKPHDFEYNFTPLQTITITHEICLIKIQNMCGRSRKRCIRTQNGFLRPCYSHQRYLYLFPVRQDAGSRAVIRFVSPLLFQLPPPTKLLHIKPNSPFLSLFSRPKIVIFILSYSNSLFLEEEEIEDCKGCYFKSQSSVYLIPCYVKHLY